jgi:hypothetical protein
MMASGLATVVLWGQSEWSGSVFKAMPGMIVPVVLYFVANALGLNRAEQERPVTAGASVGVAAESKERGD